MKRMLQLCLIMVTVAGIVGVVLSVTMLVRAVEWSEWGRVLLYGIILLVSIELSVLAVLKLRKKEDT